MGTVRASSHLLKISLTYSCIAPDPGNPIGGLVFSSAFGSLTQLHEWTNFMSDSEFCFRGCKDGPNAPALCQHIYDVMGCGWNMPGNYAAGTFERCLGDSGEVGPFPHLCPHEPEKLTGIFFRSSLWVSMEVPPSIRVNPIPHLLTLPLPHRLARQYRLWAMV